MSLGGTAMTETPPSDRGSVLVTGAGQSVGRAIAERFADAGWRTFICDVRRDLVDLVLSERPDLGGQVGDVADESSVDALFGAAEAAVGEVEVLVNVVGISGPRGPIESLTLADWRQTMQVNVDSMFLTARRAVPGMRRKRRGVIVNFSSVSTRTAMPFRAPYVASKAAVEGLTRALSRELGPDGISVNAVLPGMIDNERLRFVLGRIADDEGQDTAAIEAELLRYVSMRSKVTPSELAETVFFLASPGGRHVSGQAIGHCGNMEWER
jgi:NAD(P)-dependent dehydrogenase (short-subunit alcohol dehydrogenase family)